ncbi:MAG: lysophospholipase [Candidatus Hydrogenedentes bacterium]|nr:lysophospholipase [Candidatus Hydrogenedentota bacterium]
MKRFDVSFLFSRKVNKFESNRQRDPNTHILKGAEPLDLGNQASKIAILLIHGFAGCPNNFERLPYNLTETLNTRVKALLLPGHGTHPLDFEKISTDILLDAVIEEIIKLKKQHEKLIVLGHSMGGTLATLACVKTDFDGLILASPYYGITFNPKLIFPAEKWIRFLSPFVRWVFTPPSEQPILKKEVAENIISYHWIPVKAGLVAMELAERAKRDSILEKIVIPTLIIHSEIDSIACPKAVKEVYEKIGSKDKTLVWLKNSDHVIFWDYDKDIVQKSIEEFIKKFI